MKARPVVAALAAMLCIPARASAADVALPGELADLQIHGFVSQGFLLTSANDYLGDTSRGTFHFSEAGLNLTLPATDRLRLGMQLFARDLGPDGDYQASFDWFYLDYHWRDWLGLRAGRVKLPFGLYNDTIDIDAAHTSVLLPQSIYPEQNRDYLLAQTGGELYGYASLRAFGALDYRFYAGTILLDPKPRPGSTVTLLKLNVPYVIGGRILWTSPLEGLRLGGSLQILRLETDFLAPGSSAPIALRFPVKLAVASAEYSLSNWLLAAEYSRWFVSTESNTASIPNGPNTSERAYALASYRLNSWLQAGGYYSLLFPDVARRSGHENVQHDVALTLRFDVNRYWLIKLEGHYLNGTAALSPPLNDNQPRSALQPEWALFAVKTTAYF